MKIYLAKSWFHWSRCNWEREHRALDSRASIARQTATLFNNNNNRINGRRASNSANIIKALIRCCPFGWQPNSLAMKCHFDGIIVLAVVGSDDFLCTSIIYLRIEMIWKTEILIKSHYYYYSRYNDENRKQCPLFGVFGCASSVCVRFRKNQKHDTRHTCTN